jgi:drug/metabolite transporter (DMT)-like permease
LTPSVSTKFSISPKHPIRGYVFIATAALCWSISAALGRAVFTGRLLGGVPSLPPIEPITLAQSRTTISFLILFPVLLALRGRAGMRMSRRDFGWAMLVGVLGVAASNYFYYLSIQKTNVATAIILQYTAPVWVLLYMVVRGLQRATAKRLISCGLALLGIALIIDLFGGGRFKLDRIGVIAAMLASLAFAFYNVAGGQIVQHHDRWKVVVYVFLGAALFWAILNPPWKIIAANYSGAQWLFLLVFALTSILLPFSLYFSGLQHLDPTRAIITSCLEPVFSIVLAVILLGELLGPVQVVGIVLVLAATVLVQMPDRKGTPRVLVEPME